MEEIINHPWMKGEVATKAAGGGFAGSTMMIAARYGIARGLFSNESGLGYNAAVPYDSHWNFAAWN